MSGCGRGDGVAGKTKPNLLLITVDSLRADHLGFMGHKAAQTPALDAIAARGTVFTRALTPVPEATPALASLMTGRYPAGHGLHTGAAGALADGVPTLASVLKASGYRTGAFVSSLRLHPKYGLNQGFDVYAMSFGETPRPRQIPEDGLPAGPVTDRALEFLESAKDNPFLLWVNYFDPHYFYSPPEPFASRFASSPYDGEIAYVDREVGRLIAKLKDYGIDGRTLIVVAGSNGEGLGDHGEEYHGSTLQEATTRVPLVFVGSGFSVGARVETPASLVDVMPTLVRMLGLNSPAGVEGIALQDPADPARPIYLEARMPSFSFGWSPLTGVVSGTLKYVSGVRAELFDLSVDPKESADQSGARKTDADHLAALARAYAERSVEQRPIEENIREQIRALGYSPDALSRPRKDPRDMVGVANDALKADRTARRRQLQAAAFLFEGVLVKDPENYLSLLDTALLAGARKDLAEKQRLLEKAQALYPGDGEIYHELGHLTLSQQHAEGARRAGSLFALATALDPGNEEAHYDLACWLAQEGKKEAALDALQKAVNLGFRDFEWMSADSDLDTLRDDARFDSITGGKARKRAKAAATAARPQKQGP